MKHLVWYNSDGKFHRDDDLPAKIFSSGTQEWWKDGKRHRDGLLPAVIKSDGTLLYFLHGNLMRIETVDWYWVNDHKHDYNGNFILKRKTPSFL